MLDQFFQGDDILRIRIQVIQTPIEFCLLPISQFRLPTGCKKAVPGLMEELDLIGYG